MYTYDLGQCSRLIDCIERIDKYRFSWWNDPKFSVRAFTPRNWLTFDTWFGDRWELIPDEGQISLNDISTYLHWDYDEHGIYAVIGDKQVTARLYWIHSKLRQSEC